MFGSVRRPARTASMCLAFLALSVGQVSSPNAQSTGERIQGNSKFLLRGYFHSGLEVQEDRSSFVGGTFAPIFLWKQSDRLLFEGEMAVEFEGDEVEFGMEYANMAYLLGPAATLRLGYFLVPHGVFIPLLHPAWINRMPTMPLGMGHDGITMLSDLGAEIRGGVPVGSGKINYAAYVTNGPRLKDGSTEPDEAGQLQFRNFEDNNQGKAIGGRIGVLPIQDSSLEVGFSALYSRVGEDDSGFENVAAQLYAADLTYIKSVAPLRSIIDIRGQWNFTDVDPANYVDPEDSTGTATYSFDNKSHAYYAQLSLRPSFVEKRLVKNLEFVSRYSVFETPKGSRWASDQKQVSIGINYWLDWRTVFKFNYQNTDVTDLSNVAKTEEGHGPVVSGDVFFIHWAVGF